MRLIDADALREHLYHEAFETDTDMQRWDSGCWIRYKLFENTIDNEITIEVEKETPKRVLWSGWKGCRDTRYKCPLCEKPVRNDDNYCHRCGQRLMFPKISFTPYVEGQKQETIVRWDDETDRPEKTI